VLPLTTSSSFDPHETLISLDERRGDRFVGSGANEIDCLVGDNLRRLRRAAGLTIAALARRLEVSPTQLLKYEQGVDRIGAAVLFQLAKVFAVPAAAFYDGLPDYDAAASDPEEKALLTFFRSEEGRVLSAAYRRVRQPRQRRAILALVNLLASST
jgi:transcriptional regulator with XRE-family HTH domain